MKTITKFKWFSIITKSKGDADAFIRELDRLCTKKEAKNGDTFYTYEQEPENKRWDIDDRLKR